MSVKFSYTPTKISFAAVTVSTILAMITLVIFGINPNQPTRTEWGGWAYPASLDSLTNGCGDIYVSEPTEGQFGVIPPKYWELNKDAVANIPRHLMIIPVFGYMAELGVPQSDIKFWSVEEAKDNTTINEQTILRAMYDSDITVIWYSETLNPVDVASIRNYANEHEGKILAYPWTTNGGRMVGDRQVGFSQWGISQTCGVFNEVVADEFLEFSTENRVGRPDVIPEAPMSEDGTLFPIGGYRTNG